MGQITAPQRMESPTRLPAPAGPSCSTPNQREIPSASVSTADRASILAWRWWVLAPGAKAGTPVRAAMAARTAEQGFTEFCRGPAPPRSSFAHVVSEGSMPAVLPLRSEFFHAELPADLDPPSPPHLHPAPRNAEEVPPARSRRPAWTSLRRCRTAGRWGEAQFGSGEVLGAARRPEVAHRAHTRRLPPSLMSCDCPNHQLARRRHYTVPSESARHGTSESS